jgi:hypothetical protein
MNTPNREVKSLAALAGEFRASRVGEHLLGRGGLPTGRCIENSSCKLVALWRWGSRHLRRHRWARNRRQAIGCALKGRYRQVVDACEANSGFPLAFVFTFLMPNNPADTSALLVLRHGAFPIAQ